jgi:rubrerythrin
MAGCFGNHPVDRYLENQLFQHLEREEEEFEFENDDELFICEKCGHTCSIADIEYDDIHFYDICPKCQHKQEW